MYVCLGIPIKVKLCMNKCACVGIHKHACTQACVLWRAFKMKLCMHKRTLKAHLFTHVRMHVCLGVRIQMQLCMQKCTCAPRDTCLMQVLFHPGDQFSDTSCN